MSDDELNDLFGLDAELPPEPDGESDASSPSEATHKSDNAVRVDEWGKRRGDELADCQRWKAHGLPAEAAQDFHALAFDRKPELTSCRDERREAFIRSMVETPDYMALHKKTRLDDFAAQLAALEMGDKYAEHIRDNPPPPKPGDDIRGMVAAAQAVSAAADVVDEAREAAMMCGMGDGDDGKPLDKKRLSEVFGRVRNDPRLRKICELAGRFRRVAQSKQRMKVTGGLDEMAGVELDGDLSRIIPSELVKLDVPELEDDMLRRLAERQVQCREMHAVEPAGKGPIVVVVDESGSMKYHDKIETAKALALAMVWIARRQKRWCVLVGFSGSESGNKLVIRPGKSDDAALMEWLEHFYGRGTDMDVPLVELPGWWPEFISQGLKPGATDIIMFTDACCRVSHETFCSFTAFKAANNVKLTSIVIGGEKAGDLAGVSDQCVEVIGLDTETPVVGSILSL